jgi:hypothetical protein
MAGFEVFTEVFRRYELLKATTSAHAIIAPKYRGRMASKWLRQEITSVG